MAISDQLELPRIYLYRRLVRAKLFIDDHYAENIDLNNIADEAAFSKFHFIRLFKSVYGSTPHQHLVKVRIENAKMLLRHGNPIREVCAAVGFESLTSFSGLFKRITGASPSVFQQMEMKRKSEMTSSPMKFVPNCFSERYGWNKN